MAEHELNKIVDDDGEVFNLRDSTKQPVADRVTAWGSTPSDTKYPSEKLVKTSLDAKVSAREEQVATAQDLIQSVRVKPGGSVGSAYLTSASTVSGLSIPSAWYNYIWLPHRNGSAGNDNQKYGTLILTPLTNTPDVYVIEGGALTGSSPTYKAIKLANNTDARTISQDVSKGANLVVNGSGRMSSNYNFSNFLYVPTIASGGSAGSFGFNGTVECDEYISCDFNKKIVFSVDVKNLATQPNNCVHRIFVHEYDIDKKSIAAINVMFGVGTLTELTQDLNPGDTVVHLADLSNANWLSTTNYHHGFIFWNYTNSYGYLYPPETYSRNVYPGSGDSLSLWEVENVNVSAGTITLNNPWAGPAIPAGTKVSRRQSGGTYPYPANATISDTEWHTLKGYLRGIAAPGTSERGSKFSQGTAFIRVGFYPTSLTNADETIGKRAVFANLAMYEEQDFADGYGVLPVNLGGTGKTSVTAGNYLVGNGTSALTEKAPNTAANELINALSTGESTPTGEDYYVAQYAGGGTTTKTYHRRPIKALWEYIKSQISSVLGLTATSYGGNAATATALASGSADRTKLDGIAAGAEVNVQSDWNQASTTADDYIKNKPTIPAAVRVKGDAESLYRTGDVNLTPANIGLTDAAIRGKISAGTDLSYDSSTGVMKVNTTGAATGNYAFVSGLATAASGNYSNAEGYKTTASSTSSHAEGSKTTASTPAAHAEGYKTTASGISAHAEGYRDDGDEFAGFSVASGFGSHIEGIDTKASDDASHAEGYLTESSGPHAHAEGESTVASGKDSHAEGLWSTASGLNSHAENSSFAYGENAHSEGYCQSSWGAVGVASHTEGSDAFAYGISAHAEGGGTNALGKDSHAEGLGGGYRPIAITLTANHVAETSTFTGSTEGLSVGMYLLWKDDAHLTQQVSKITWVGNGTFGTQATFDSAIPAGTVVYAVDRGVAAGAASHVEGFGTSAVGMYSHAEGYLTKAIGEASHAEGQGTEARTGGMHAAGMYPATKEGFARVTGWGSAASPKDIERLSTQGTLWVGGHFYGATPLKVVPGQTTYDEIYEAWSEQRPFVIEVSMLTRLAHAIYAPATIRAVPLDQAMDHWEFHFRVDYPYNYRAAFYAGGQEPYKVSVYYLAINEQQGWGKLVSGSNEWASLSDSRWYSVPVEYAALAETATEAQNAAASSPLANAINGKSDVGHKHPISDLTMGILSASLGGTGYNNLSDACSALLKAVTLGTDPTMYADDEIMGSSHTSGTTDTSKFVRRKASTMKAYVLNGGTMTGQFTNSYQGYGYRARHGTSNKYVGFEAYREDTQVGVSLEVGSNGKNHGVYSAKLGAWMLYENDDGKIHIYNDRLIINSAGALRGSNGVVTITNAAENAGGVLSAGALRQTSYISKSDTFEVTNTDATVRGDGQLYFYRNTNATSAILAKWHVNSASTFATGYIQPGCTGVFQLTNNASNYFTRLS